MEPRDPTSSTALPFRRKPRCGSRQVTSFASKPPAVAAGEKEKRDDLGARVVARSACRRDLGSLRRRRGGGGHFPPRPLLQNRYTTRTRAPGRPPCPAGLGAVGRAAVDSATG